MVATIAHGQSILDVALQYLGSAEGCFIIADKLGVSITGTETTYDKKLKKDINTKADLAGRTFEYFDEEVIDPQVVEYYRQNNIVPTTDIEPITTKQTT